MIKPANLYLQYKSQKKEIDKAILKIISNNSFIGGDEVKKFENNFKKRIGSRYCVACGNGTDALLASVKSLGFKSKIKNEVITTSHTWFSTASAITNAGGKVIFCDTEKDSYNISVNEIEKKVTKRTSGIVIVHLFGQPAQIEKILQLANKYKLWVIEDCAQAHFIKKNKKYLGNFGHIGTFSFYPGKNLGAMGDAGAIITNNKRLRNLCIMHLRHGGQRKHEHLLEGLNSRLDGLQAAILNIKLRKIDTWNKKREIIAKEYLKNLSNLSAIKLPISNIKRNAHGFHQFVIKAKKRDELRKFLYSKKINTLIHYPKILPFVPAYKYQKNKKKEFPNSLKNQRLVLSLPIYPELKIKEVRYISRMIKKFYKF